MTEVQHALPTGTTAGTIPLSVRFDYAASYRQTGSITRYRQNS